MIFREYLRYFLWLGDPTPAGDARRPSIYFSAVGKEGEEKDGCCGLYRGGLFSSEERGFSSDKTQKVALLSHLRLPHTDDNPVLDQTPFQRDQAILQALAINLHP